jgi:hypothetical protein
VPWKLVEKLFFKSGLILLGQGKKQGFFQKNMFGFFNPNIFWDKQNCSPKISCHNSEPSKHCWGPE